MDVDLIFKIAAIGIIVAVLNQVLIRAGREEQAMMTTLAGLIVVLMMLIYEISNLFEAVKNPYVLGMVVVSVWNAINDPTTEGVSDSNLAMTYIKPHSDKGE